MQTVVLVGKQIPGSSYAAIFPETYQSLIILTALLNYKFKYHKIHPWLGGQFSDFQ